MKIRNGFVSNSSSSSFIALGFSIKENSSLYKDILLTLGVDEIEFDNKVSEYIKRYNDNEDTAIRDVFYEEYDNLLDKEDIMILSGSEGGVGEDDEVIALMLAEANESSGGCFSSGEVVLNDDDSDYRKIKEIKDKICPDAKIRILYGTRNC